MLQKQPPANVAVAVRACALATTTRNANAAKPAWFDRLTMSAHPELVEGCGRVRTSSCSDADRAAHAGATEAAVPVPILREVLLMVVLGVVELGRRLDLRRDRAVSRRGQLLLERVARSLGRAPLIVVRVVDAGPVLRAGIVPLPHALRRIVVLPEHFQQIVVADRLRI